MSQNVRDRQPQPESPDPVPPSTQPAPGFAADAFACSIDSNADRLMDELFEDMERMLDRGVQLPIEPTEPAEMATLQPPAVSLALPTKLTPRQLMVRPEEPEALAATSSSAPRQTRPLNKLLLLAVGASLAAAGLLWLLVQHRLPAIGSLINRQTGSDVAVVPPTAEEAKQQQHKSFLDYLQRSLDRIDRGAEANRQPATTGTPAATVATAPTVLERVYVPVYQPPQVPAAPTVSFPSPTVPSPATAPARAPVAAAPNIAPTAAHVLIGVMELGDRSAALFEIGGTPRRIQVGEAIGASGWTLVSIANQEAIVRRNGEVRSIYVGQQF